MSTSNIINLEFYNKKYDDSFVLNTKLAKEYFFLKPDDLKHLSHHRASEVSEALGYCKRRACKYFKVNELIGVAIATHGSLDVIIEKAKKLNQKRQNKVTSDQRKREEQQYLIHEANKKVVERARLEEIEQKNQEQLEEKRQIELREKDAASWRQLVGALREYGIEFDENGDIDRDHSLVKLVKDHQEWKKKSCMNTIDACNSGSMDSLKIGIGGKNMIDESPPNKRARVSIEGIDDVIEPRKDEQQEDFDYDDDSDATINLIDDSDNATINLIDD